MILSFFKKVITLIFFTAMFHCPFASEHMNTFSVATKNKCTWTFNDAVILNKSTNEIRFDKTGLYSVSYLNEMGDLVTSSVFYNAETGKQVKLFVIGDSTASFYDSGRFPRTGWAQVLQAFFIQDSVLVQDKALSGRSSKSFYTDPNGWPVVQPALSEGDYLFIQFGHNDEKSDNSDLYTLPYSTFQDYLKKYIDEARVIGAIPVLLTPIHRNGWTGEAINNSHGEYPAAMIDLAHKESVPLIDLTAGTQILFENYGSDFVSNNFFMNLPATLYPNYPDGNSDNTHLQDRGAYEVAKLTIKMLQDLDDEPSLSKLVANAQEAGFIKINYNDYKIGNVSGGGVHPYSDEVILKANAASGYVFGGYFRNDELLTNESTYPFSSSDSITEITANFEIGFKVNLSIDPKYKGRVQGSGTYRVGDSITVVATPYAGYRFKNWTLDDVVMSTDSLYQFKMKSENVALVAHLNLATSLKQNHRENSPIHFDRTGHSIRIKSEDAIRLVEIFDENGKLIVKKNFNEDSVSIALMKSKKGLVVVKVRTASQVFMRKIIIN